MFLLRGGEWLAHNGRGYDTAKVILGSGIRARKEGRPHDLAKADEVSVEVRASKIDRYNTGTWRNHYASHKLVCPVRALDELQNQHPERFGKGSEALLPLFRKADGSPLWSNVVKHLLETAAGDEGLPTARFGTHSLRIGGATALLHAGVHIDIIKRWGRWVSDSFQRYLWEAEEDAKDLATKMASDKTTLSATRQTNQ